ncbi:MAG: SprB repeat-containing protein, partial [Bacteroidales bacterium]|nr:SprB repeat-containing protein [Bacteroidales bacterium]
MDYKCEFNSLSGWTPSTQSNGIWHIGTGQDGAKYVHETTTFVCNQLNKSDSYLYIDNDDIAENVSAGQNQLKDAYISQKFSFSGVNMPILSFDYYYYFDNKQQKFQAPIIRIDVDLNGDGKNYQPVFPTSDDPLQPADEWQHANVCLTKVANHAQCDVRIHVLSAAAGHFKISFDNFEIQNFSKTSITPTPASCFGYDNGAIEIEVKGGGPNYDYSCDNGVTWVDNVAAKKYKFTDKTNGIYNLQVRDAQTRCAIGPFSFTLEADVPEITFSATPSDIECFGQTDGYIELHGNSNLQYSLNDGAYETTTKFENLSGGDYTIRAKDGECESAPQTVTIGSDVFMEIEEVIPTHITRCYGDKTGSIYVNASVSTGQIDYSFDGGQSWNNHRDTKEK